MPKRVSPAEIQEFYRLYEQYGTFAEVGRRTNRSAATVSRYIQLKTSPRSVPKTIRQVTHKKA